MESLMVITGARWPGRISTGDGRILKDFYIQSFSTSKKWWGLSKRRGKLSFTAISMVTQEKRTFLCMGTTSRINRKLLASFLTSCRNFAITFHSSRVGSLCLRVRSKRLDWQCLKSSTFLIYLQWKLRFVAQIKADSRTSISQLTTWCLLVEDYWRP